MLAEVPRFHRAARRLLADGAPGDAQTLGEFLADGGFSGYFTAHFALPLVAAVWSCPPGTALSYPARYLFAFLANHGMLSVSGSPPWRTVTGGSRCYVERAAERLPDVRLCAPVRAVRRHPGGAEVRDAAGQARRVRRRGHRHPSRPGAAPARPAHPGRAGGARRVPLHPESRPAAHRHQPASATARRIRASWNYELGDCQRPARPRRPRISYHMNRLQSLPAGRGLHRDAGRPGRRRPRRDHRPDGLRASGLHAGLGRRAAPPARAEHRRSPPSPAPTTAGASTRTAAGPAPRRPARSGGPGDRGARWPPAPRCTSAGSPTPGPRRCGTCSPTAATSGWSTSTTCPGSGRALRLLAGFHARDHLGDPRRPIRDNLDHFLARPRHRPGRRPGDDAGARARARVRVQPADRLLVPPGRRHARLRGGRGAQHLRQRHAYLLHTDDRGRAQVPKEFYVSPFYPVDGRYRMSLPEPGRPSWAPSMRWR